MHIGNKKGYCPELKIHDKKMSETHEEKYLGDLFSDDGSNQKNLTARRNKAYGIVSEIMAILKEVPLGQYKIEAGLQLRNAMLLNGILTNSEVWYGLKDEDIVKLEQVDDYFLRELLNAHSKTAKEMLYLETGAKPIRFVIKNRRLGYLHHILTRDQDEVLYKFYTSQLRNPTKDDWVNSIMKDKTEMNLNLPDEQIKKNHSKSY